MCQKFEFISLDEVQIEYSYVEKELNAYSGIDDKLDQLIYIKQLLKARKCDNYECYSRQQSAKKYI